MIIAVNLSSIDHILSGQSLDLSVHLSDVVKVVENVVDRRLGTGTHEKEIVVLQLRLCQVGLAGASVNLWQRPQNILQHVEQQAEQRPLAVVELDAVFDAAFEGLWTVGAHTREIRPEEAASNHEEDLILVVDVTVGKLFGEQLVENDAEGVHVGLERVGVLLVHSDDFRGHPAEGQKSLLKSLLTFLSFL